MPTRCHRWLLIALLCSTAATFAAEPEPLPTSAELHKLFDDAQYQPLLAKLPRVLALKGPAAAGYDKVDLNLLKADTFIALKQQAQAITAMNDAVKAVTPQTQPKLSARARAQQILFKQSTSLAYTPKAGTAKTPIPLSDVAQRPAAYKALLADMQAEVNARIKTAQSSKTLPPIITAVQSLADMGAVELMATGSDEASRKAADDLAGGAKKLMTEGVAVMAGRVAEIDKKANELTFNRLNDTAVGPKPEKGQPQKTVKEQTYRKAGLTSASRGELRDIMDTCARIESACRDFEAVSKQQAAGFEGVASNAAKTARDAETTMTADYTGDYTDRGRRY